MNLQVNLLTPTEQRSASPINLKTLLRILYLSVPVGLAIVFASAVIDLLTMKSELRRLNERWVDLEPRKIAAEQKQLTMIRNRDILAELKGWENSQIHWHAMLKDICNEIPATIQIQTLAISQDTPLIGKKTPARVFRMQLTGKAKGQSSEQDIQSLCQRLSALDVIASARVTNYGADYSQNAEEHDRVFSMTAEFTARIFE